MAHHDNFLSLEDKHVNRGHDKEQHVSGVSGLQVKPPSYVYTLYPTPPSCPVLVNFNNLAVKLHVLSQRSQTRLLTSCQASSLLTLWMRMMLSMSFWERSSSFQRQPFRSIAFQNICRSGHGPVRSRSGQGSDRVIAASPRRRDLWGHRVIVFWKCVKLLIEQLWQRRRFFRYLRKT